jgi:hypothetical protein
MLNPGEIVGFPDESQYIHRGKLFLVIRYSQWESSYNGSIFNEVDVLEFGTTKLRKFRVEHLRVV